MIRTIAFFLPQFYPTPDNDRWWGKGFTEWTNVGRAKPLFKGHYQPRIPADLGYYDLRIPEVREQQAELAKEAGIEGFCYWHYWFAGTRLLDRVFNEVVQSGSPDFPFCLCWANHSWKAKTWDPNIPDKTLIEQTYPGESDYIAHFNAMLAAFKDKRYMRVNGRLIFGIFEPASIPDMETMYEIWNRLATENGLGGFYFFGFAQGSGSIKNARKPYFDAIVYDAMYDAVYSNLQKIGNKIRAKLNPIIKRPIPLSYNYYTSIAVRKFQEYPDTIPCIDPNFDHSPRSGSKGVILHQSTPDKWKQLCEKVATLVSERSSDNLLFIKSWNEWGEGNYLEPDLRFGKQYIEATKEGLYGNK